MKSRIETDSRRMRRESYADLILVDGDPLANIKLIADPQKYLAAIMKDGKVYKNQIR
jgi:imidazolonepropionase-like amidohydrolase